MYYYDQYGIHQLSANLFRVSRLAIYGMIKPLEKDEAGEMLKF